MTQIQKQDFTTLVKEIYDEVPEGLNITKKDLTPIIESVFKAVHVALLDDKDVALGDVGKLKINERKARKGRNPQSGEEIDIPSRKVVKFAESKQLETELKAK